MQAYEPPKSVPTYEDLDVWKILKQLFSVWIYVYTIVFQLVAKVPACTGTGTLNQTMYTLTSNPSSACIVLKLLTISTCQLIHHSAPQPPQNAHPSLAIS